MLPPKVPYYVRQVFDFFDKLGNSWNISGGFVSIVQGLNYQNVEFLSKVYKFKLTPLRMRILQMIEQRYVEKFNAKSKEK